MNRKKIATLAMLAAINSAPFLSAAYWEPQSYKNPNRVITLGSSGYSTGGSNDKWVFQKAINNVSRAGGGIVKGTVA